MIFDESRLIIARQDRSTERRHCLASLLATSRAAFPEVRIRLLETIAVVNAQASVLDKIPTVDLFGGLIFHPALGQDGLAFSLAHELGHHLAVGPRQICGSPLACDCAADLWAVTIGLNVLSREKAKLTVKSALRQLRSIAKARPRNHTSVLGSSQKCWALDWSRREKALNAGGVAAVTKCWMFGR